MMHPYIQYSKALDPDLHKISREKKEQKNTVIDIHVALLTKLVLDAFPDETLLLSQWRSFLIVALG